MPKIILLNHVNHDGIGDFSHLVDIYQALSSNKSFSQVQFIPIVCCIETQIGRIKNELADINAINYFVGTKEDYQEKFKTRLQGLLNESMQVIQVSFSQSFLHSYIIPPTTLCKYIGEHEAQINIPNPISREWGVGNVAMGFSPKHLGIKIKRPPRIDKLMNLFEDYELSEKEDKFKQKLLAVTHSVDMIQFYSTNLLCPAYFNNYDNLWRFLLFVAINKKLQNNEKNIAIYLSGLSWHVDKLTVPSFYSQYLDKTNIQSIEFIGFTDDALLTHLINPQGTKTIRIFCGFYLGNRLYEALYQQASLVAVSGDNTFEKAISNQIFPFYCSTNMVMKRPTFTSLSKIIENDTIEMLPEAIKNDYVTYFSNFFHFVHTHVIVNHPSPRIIELFSATIVLFENLDVDGMMEHWPKVAMHLFKNYNFYEKLEGVILDGVEPAVQQGMSESIEPLVSLLEVREEQAHTEESSPILPKEDGLEIPQEMINNTQSLDSNLNSYGTLLDLSAQYKNQRKRIADEYYHWSFFSKLFGGFSRTEKLEAMQALEEVINGELNGLEPRHLKILRQGSSGAMIKAWEQENNLNIDFLLENALFVHSNN